MNSTHLAILASAGLGIIALIAWPIVRERIWINRAKRIAKEQERLSEALRNARRADAERTQLILSEMERRTRGWSDES